MTVVKPRITPLSSIRSTRRLTAGRRQVHPLPDLGERGPRMLGQLGQNALVGLVQTVHRHLHATKLRHCTSGAIDHVVIYAMNGRLIAQTRSTYRLIHDDFRSRRAAAPVSESPHTTRARTRAQRPPLRHDGADLLRRRVRDQPVDGHLDPRRHRTCALEPVGRRCARPTRNSATPSSWSSPSPACRTWSTPPTAACSSTARPSSPASPTRSAQANRPPTPSG